MLIQPIKPITGILDIIVLLIYLRETLNVAPSNSGNKESEID